MKIFAIPSLRWRLVAVMCLAYVIVSAVTEMVGYNQQRDNLRHQLETRAKADAVILAAGAISPYSSIHGGQSAALSDFVTSLTQAQGVNFAAVYDLRGCPLAATVPVRRLHCLQHILSLKGGFTTLPNGDVQGLAPIVQDTTIGVAIVTLSAASVDSDVQQTLRSDLLLRGVGFLIFVLLSLAIAQFILGPLTALVRATRAIQQGRLDTRVPPGGQTELATVSDAFNDMARALELRIQHLSFLAATAPVLPAVFRDQGDAAPTLREFCSQLDTRGAGLLPLHDDQRSAVWYDVVPGETAWHEAALDAIRAVNGPSSLLRQDQAIMVVPVLGNTVFVTGRAGEHSFSREEQQVITNFAYQLGVAADNARLFEAQQEALQVKDQFLSIVSHELRTPVTTIKGYAQILRRKLADDRDGLRYALNIDAQVTRLARLVDDLLDVTRFSRGEFELKRGDLDLRPLLEDLVARFRIIAPKHEFILALDEGEFVGEWDRDRLEQVMNNLVGNAVKYSPTGGTITISTRHQDDNVIVSVRDQGPGISAEDQQRLFERFYRGAAEGTNVKGLGLGLYVSHRIVEAHGGALGINSCLGEGAEFFFALPLAPVPALR